jgi:electron-transferring-flavoprotein dehydrogenase
VERKHETLEVDVLFVGAGPASLSGAIHLRNLVDSHNHRYPAGAPCLEAVSIAVIEKGREVGAHSLSGAILDTRALRELMPEVDLHCLPATTPVTDDTVCFLTSHRKIPIPWIPPPLRNKGNFIISLNRFVRWLGEQAEARDGRGGLGAVMG